MRNASLKALICAPLRAGQRTVGIIALASTAAGRIVLGGESEAAQHDCAADGAAIANSLLCAEMVDAARARAAFAAELQAASTVQQLLLQSASRPTPGFQVESVYLPAARWAAILFCFLGARRVITAIVGDVSGKGLTAAMRVAMILGALRAGNIARSGRDSVRAEQRAHCAGTTGFHDGLLHPHFAQRRIRTLANAGHIAPYLSGRELETPPALPLGLVPGQNLRN